MREPSVKSGFPEVLKIASILVLAGFFLVVPLYSIEGAEVYLAFGLLLLLLLCISPQTGAIVYYSVVTFAVLSGLPTDYQVEAPLVGTITYKGMLTGWFAVGGLVACLIRSSLTDLRKTVANAPGLKYFLAFSLTVLAIAVLAHRDGESLKGVLDYIAPVVFYLLLSLYSRRDSYRTLGWVVSLTLLVVVGKGLSLYLNKGAILPIERAGVTFLRYKPDVLSAVDYSLLIVTLAPIALLRFVDGKSVVMKAIWLVLLCASVLSVTLFWARASLGALLACTTFFFFARRRYWLGSALVLLGVALVWLTPARFLIVDVVGTGATSSSSSTLAQRIFGIWVPAISGGLSNFLLGVGARGFGGYYYNLTGIYLTAVHSIYVRVLVELGVVPLLLFVCANLQVIVRSIGQIRRSESRIQQRRLASLALPLIVYLVGAATSTAWFKLFYLQIFVFLTMAQLLTLENKQAGADTASRFGQRTASVATVALSRQGWK